MRASLHRTISLGRMLSVALMITFGILSLIGNLGENTIANSHRISSINEPSMVSAYNHNPRLWIVDSISKILNDVSSVIKKSLSTVIAPTTLYYLRLNLMYSFH